MKKLRVGINGFGRIGRAFTRIASDCDDFTISAINTSRTDSEMLAYLLQYDSVYRTFGKKVVAGKDYMSIDGLKIATYMQPDPALIPWGKHHVDLVIDCTGVFKNREDLKKHLRDSVKKVVVTAPVGDPSIEHVVMGVNDMKLSGKEDIISNGSCTTNCAALLLQVLEKHFGIEASFITTAHAYTSSQPVLDTAGKSFTRSRAAGLSMIPTTTGASEAVCKVTDVMKHSLGALAIRVPTPVGSLCDITALLKKHVSVDMINDTFRHESETTLKNYLGYTSVPLVSSDYIGNPYSCVFDSNYTAVLQGNFIKVFGWYDNEWGYSSRLVDLVKKLAS